MAVNREPILSIAALNMPSETADVSSMLIQTTSSTKKNVPSKQMTTRKLTPKKMTTIKTSSKASHIIKTPVKKATPARKPLISSPSTLKKSALKHKKFSIPKKHTDKTRNRKTKIVRFSTADYTWQCWQCLCAFSEETDLGLHLKTCDTRSVKQDQVTQSPSAALSGCPFCPRDGFQADIKPFFFSDFNAHMKASHADVKSLVCPYCLDSSSISLQDLTAHIILSHHVHWRPCPSSLVYMRIDDVSHRVVTCLGCGWCTFVLRANDAAKPPTSLSSHMNRCACQGGQIHLPRLPPLATGRRVAIEALTKKAEEISRAFAARFPGVRGFGENHDAKPLPRLNMRYESPLRNKRVTPKMLMRGANGGNERNCKLGEIDQALASFSSPSTSTSSSTIEPPPVVVETNDLVNGQVTISTSKPEKKVLPSPTPPPPPIQPNFVPKGVSFDVPLNLPPPPPSQTHGRSGGGPGGTKKTVARVYVCPICGDNALSSLRERDEHLQAEHHGELVFPCQLCGMAYPLYIALRRHAVLKHLSNFDAVLYGQPDAEPTDCPYCELVAFTSPEVLQQHLAKIHPDQVQQQAVVSAVASAIGPEDDDENDKDWTENGKPLVEKKGKLEGAGNGRRGGKTGIPGDFISGDLLEDPDLLESVESFFGPGGNGSSFSRGRGFRGGNRYPRGITRGARGYRSSGGGSRGRKPKSAQLQQLQPQPPSHQQLDATIYTTSLLTDAEDHSIEDSTMMTSEGDQGLNNVVIMAMDPLEITLANTSGAYAPATCRLCGPQGQVVLDNPKELVIHFELDHNPASTCEQLGCQACGRIFFGPNHRIDLIGHFRIAHQEGQEEALICPNHNSDCGAMADSDLDAVLSSGCQAKFTSQRLLDSHLLTEGMLPGWTCPLSLNAELVQAMTGSSSSDGLLVDGFDPVVLATEIAADAAGQLILAYGCPICSRVFTGENCTARYLDHRSHCHAMITEDEFAAMHSQAQPADGLEVIQVADPQQTQHHISEQHMQQ